MPWKAEVCISEGLYQISGPVFYVGRLLGIYPITIRKKDDQVFLKWSFKYVVYSFIVGSILTILTYGGVLLDILAPRERSTKIQTNTDMYVVFADTLGKQSVLMFSVFVDGIGFFKFFELMRCLNEIDTIMPPNNPKVARRVAIFLMAAILTATIAISAADIIMYYMTSDQTGNKDDILARYLASYGTYCVDLMAQFRFWHLNGAISRRLKQLNENLQMKCFRKRGEDSGVVRTIFKRIASRDKLNSVGINLRSVPRKPQQVSTHSILSLTVVYIKLYDSSKFLNELTGVTNAVTILDLLWHFVETPYHLLSEVMGPRKSPAFITMMVAWCTFHFSRFVMVFEPCNVTVQEAEKTRKLACKLLYSDFINQESKYELNLLFKVLNHCKIKFSAAGLVTIDRLLVTGMFGTVATYLVVVMQYK